MNQTASRGPEITVEPYYRPSFTTPHGMVDLVTDFLEAALASLTGSYRFVLSFDDKIGGGGGARDRMKMIGLPDPTKRLIFIQGQSAGAGTHWKMNIQVPSDLAFDTVVKCCKDMGDWKRPFKKPAKSVNEGELRSRRAELERQVRPLNDERSAVERTITEGERRVAELRGQMEQTQTEIDAQRSRLAPLAEQIGMIDLELEEINQSLVEFDRRRAGLAAVRAAARAAAAQHGLDLNDPEVAAALAGEGDE